MATDLLKYLNAGIQSYTVPPGISSLKLHLWGAGGSSGQPGAGQQVQTGTRTEQVQTGTRTVQQPSGTTTIIKNGSFSAPAGSSGTWLVPQGTTSVTVTATGGGGGGGGYHQGKDGDCGAKGGAHKGFSGGAGGSAQATLAVSPGQSISYAVGRGGFRGSRGQAAGPGGYTQFGSVRADGGGGGGTYGGSAGVPGGGGGGGAGGGPGTHFNDDPDGKNGAGGSLTVTYTYQETITNYVAVQEPVYENRTVAVYTTYNGGAGGQGAGGAYAFQEIKVDAGDIITFIVGGRGMRTEGGSSLQTPFNFQGGSASGGGGGGGGATVVLKNGNIVAVAGGGGGGGGGSPASGSSAGTAGGPGIPGGAYNTLEKTLYNGQNSNSRGGGGGGGFYGGTPGADVNNVGAGGRGGGSVGELIDPGSGTIPGGKNTTYFAEASRRGHAEIDGAIIVELVLQMSLLIKNKNSWRVTTEQYVKVNNVWKDLRLGWTKVAGQWLPLGYDGTVGTTPVTYSLASNVATVNEGSTVGFTLTTTGLPSGVVIPYTASGVQETDLDQGNMTGSFIVGLTPTIVFTPTSNYRTNGPKTLSIRLNNTTLTANCIINDTSIEPSGNASIVSGSGFWTVPPYVYRIRVTLIGGGAGGGGGRTYGLSNPLSAKQLTYTLANSPKITNFATETNTQTFKLSTYVPNSVSNITVRIRKHPSTAWISNEILTINIVRGTAQSQTSPYQRKQFYLTVTYDGIDTVSFRGYYSGAGTDSPQGGAYLNQITWIENITSGGGGGGSGGIKVTTLNVQPGANIQYNVGTGGIGGSHYSQAGKNTPNFGINGGTTTFGQLFVYGGNGQTEQEAEHYYLGGAGGSPGGTSGLNAPVVTVDDAGGNYRPGANGGGVPGYSIGGVGAPGQVAAANGGNGQFPGGGGGGGNGGQNDANNGAGGDGAGGAIYIVWNSTI